MWWIKAVLVKIVDTWGRVSRKHFSLHIWADQVMPIFFLYQWYFTSQIFSKFHQQLICILVSHYPENNLLILRIVIQIYICDALHDLAPFVQFTKCRKHPWRTVTFSKVASLSLQLSKSQALVCKFSAKGLHGRCSAQSFSKMFNTDLLNSTYDRLLQPRGCLVDIMPLWIGKCLEHFQLYSSVSCLELFIILFMIKFL